MVKFRNYIFIYDSSIINFFFWGQLNFGQPSNQSVGSTNRKYTNWIVFYDIVRGYVDPYSIFMYYLQILICAIVVLAIFMFASYAGDDKPALSGSGGGAMVLGFGIIALITVVIFIGFILRKIW